MKKALLLKYDVLRWNGVGLRVFHPRSLMQLLKKWAGFALVCTKAYTEAESTAWQQNMERRKKFATF